MTTYKSLEFKYTIAADPAELADLRFQITECLQDTPFDEKTRRWVVLAIDEAVSDLLQGKITVDVEGRLEVAITLSDSCLKAVVKDTTIEFSDPQAFDDNESLLQRARSCKLSLHLMCAVMDEVTYQYTRGFRNELCMLKFFG